MAKKIAPKIRNVADDDFARFAMEDFGSVDVPIPLRREARLLATRLGITPRQALDQLRPHTPQPAGTKIENRSASTRPERTQAIRQRRHKARASSGPDPHRKPSRTTPTGETPPIWVLRREAITNGRKWIRTNCTVCGEDVFIHVEWEKPLVLCKRCRA